MSDIHRAAHTGLRILRGNAGARTEGSHALLVALLDFGLNLFAGYQNPIFIAVVDMLSGALQNNVPAVLSGSIDYILGKNIVTHPTLRAKMGLISDLLTLFEIYRPLIRLWLSVTPSSKLLHRA